MKSKAPGSNSAAKAAGKKRIGKATNQPAGKAANERPGKAANEQHLEVAYRIDVLLHTMRSIERHEEQLCTILHDIKLPGGLTPDVTAELHSLLDELPSHVYQADLDAVREALTAAGTSSEISAPQTSPLRQTQKHAARRRR